LYQIPEKYILDLINLAALFIVCVIKLRMEKPFRLFIKLFWEDQMIHSELKDQKKASILKNTFLFLTSIYFGLFSSSILLYFDYINSDSFWGIFIIASILLFAFILLKKASLLLIGYIFDLKEHSNYLSTYKFSKSIYWFFFFYLAQILLLYSSVKVDYILLLVGALAVIYLLISIIRFQLRFQNEIFRYWYYFILYLCTLEIAPFILLYKAISESLN